MNKKKENTVDVINVIEKDIAPCRGCFGCWAKMDGHCIIQDDQNEILDLYTKADVIIWSFPLYCYSMPSHLKAVLDRTIPLDKMRMVEESDGTFRHEALVDFSRIHTLVICGCGFPEHHFSEEITDRLRAELTKRDSIVFITACLLDHEQNDDDCDGMHKMFAEQGLSFAIHCVIDKRTDPETANELVENAV